MTVRLPRLLLLSLLASVSCDRGTADPVVEAPASVVALAGDAQGGEAGTRLPAPLVARVLDADGRPVAGASVVWAVPAGGGFLSSPSATTDADGRATAVWTLGTAAGANAATASAGDRTALFSATGRAGAPASLTRVSGDAQSAPAGGALPAPVVVRVTDRHGNAVSGVTVGWAVTGAGGSASPGTSVTGSTGEAGTRWTLAGTSGANSLTVTVAGAPAVTFHAIGLATSDTSKPVIAGYALAPAIVNDSTLRKEIAFTAEVTDSGSGVAEVVVHVKSPNAGHVSGCAATRTGGTPNRGTYGCTISIGASAEGGIWRVELITARDLADNSQELSFDALQAAGFPVAFEVDNPDQDTEKPLISAYSLTPASVNLRTGNRVVVFTLDVTDGGSGVSAVGVQVRGPVAGQVESCVATLTSGTPDSGRYRCAVTLPPTAERGTWTVELVSARDVAGNTRDMTFAALQTAGFPVTFTATD